MSAPWFQCPIDLGDAVATHDLAHRLARKDVRLYLLNLWSWGKRHATDGTVKCQDANLTIEAAAGWKGKRGAFALAAHQSGFIQITSEAIRIVPPTDVIRVEWVAFSGPTAVKTKAPAKTPAERAQARRDRLRPSQTVTPVVTDRHEASRDDVTKRHGESHENVTQNVTLSPALKNETKTDTEKESEKTRETATPLALVQPTNPVNPARPPAHSHEQGALTDAKGRTWSTPEIFAVVTLWRELHQPTLALTTHDEDNLKPRLKALRTAGIDPLKVMRGAMHINAFGDYVGEAGRCRNFQLTRLLQDDRLINGALAALAKVEVGEKPPAPKGKRADDSRTQLEEAKASGEHKRIGIYEGGLQV